MAANKNQHFVPRCYLKPFTWAGEGKAINLFNIDLEQAISNAPVKGQCSGDYFYGENLVLERRLQGFEGEYARCLAAVSGEAYRLTDADAATLCRFWLLQNLRTEAASQAAVNMFAQLDDDLGGLPPGYKMEIKEAVQAAMHAFFEAPNLVDDLRVRLVRNLSPTKFVTSDNPAVLTNRWHLSWRRPLGVAPGMQSAGAVGLLPLTPEILLLIFDPDVYHLEHQHGWMELKRAQDADAFNQQQVLHCAANLYFRAWEDRTEVNELALRLAERRPDELFHISYAVVDHVEANGDTIFKTIDKAAAKDQAAFIHMSRRTPVPMAWPSILSWRRGGCAYDSRSGAGIVRKAMRVSGVDYEKLRLHV